jgi:hypothetical protein
MRPKIGTWLVAVVTFVGAFSVAPNADAVVNLVQNGDFETGNLTGWSANGWFATSGIAGVTPDLGNYFASTGCVGSFCSLSQTLATVPGAIYSLSFAFNPGQGVSPSGNTGGDFQVFWNGAQVVNIVGGNLGWTDYVVKGLVATLSNTVLLFEGYQNPAWNGLDKVSVVASAVPEPSTWAMMLLGFIGIGFAFRQSRRKVSMA